MADSPEALAVALDRWRSGEAEAALAGLAAAVADAGGHREPFAALIALAREGGLEDAERLMIALAHRTADPAMRSDLRALFQANRRPARLAELAGAPAAAWLRLEAASESQAGRWVEARSRYEALLAAAPGDPDALHHLGVLARNLGDLDAAEAWLTRAIAASPAPGPSHADLGLLRWRRGDDATAIPLLETALRAFPGNLRLAGYLAEAYADAAAPERARDCLAGALRAGGPWDEERLAAQAFELLAHPGVYAALFEAIAHAHPATPLAEACARRLAHRAPQPREGLSAPWAAVLALREPQRVSLCMIVRDEAAVLGRCLESARGMADELIVVDTGSSDDTVAIAERHGARVRPFAWTGDFAEARNESLRHATGDWILVLDADHMVDARCRRGFKRFWQRSTTEGGAPIAYRAQVAEHLQDDAELVHARAYHLAVFPNDPDLRYDGAIHEQLVDRRDPPRRLAFRPLNDLVLHHFGYAEQALTRHRKRERNMAILQRVIAERPDDPFVRFNMALQLRAEGAHAEAIDHLRRALALAGTARAPFVESAHILLAELLVRRRAYAEAEAACQAGLKAYPRTPDLLGMLGLCRLMGGRPAEAIAPLTQALAHHGTIGATAANPHYTGWLSELMLAMAHGQLGEAERRDAHLRRMWTLAPDRQAAVERVVHFSAALTGGPEAGVAWLSRLGVNVDLAPRTP